MNERFTDLADLISETMGKWWVTATSVVLVLIWVSVGPLFHFSDTWQLIINTPTTVIELWIGFLLAAATNRVERHHDQLLKEIKAHAAADLRTTQSDVATTHRAEQELQEMKQELQAIKRILQEVS
jgi:low affinity Fe/Cu permease